MLGTVCLHPSPSIPVRWFADAQDDGMEPVRGRCGPATVDCLSVFQHHVREHDIRGTARNFAAITCLDLKGGFLEFENLQFSTACFSST